MNVSEMMRVKVESTLETNIVNLIDWDYSVIAGDKLKMMFAKDIVKIVQEEFREIDSVDVGQILWMGVYKDDRPSYEKTAWKTRMIPVSLTLLCREDMEMRLEGYSQREVRGKRIVRLFTRLTNKMHYSQMQMWLHCLV